MNFTSAMSLYALMFELKINVDCCDRSIFHRTLSLPDNYHAQIQSVGGGGCHDPLVFPGYGYTYPYKMVKLCSTHLGLKQCPPPPTSMCLNNPRHDMCLTQQ